MRVSAGKDAADVPELAEVVVPLRAVLERAELDVRVVVAPADPSVAVRWAHPSEVRDPVPYLLGSELLLTAGVALPTSAGELDEYVSGLVRAGVSALGFGLTPVYDSVPADLVRACREHGLPLLEIPETTPFLAVSRAVAESLGEERDAGLRRLSEAEIALTRAATRAEPVAATLGTLTRTLGCWAVLLSARGEVLDSSGSAPALDTEVLDLAVRLRDGAGPRSASTEIAVSGVRQPVVLHPVESAATWPSVLVAGREHGFTVQDRAVLAVAVALLGVLDRERASRASRSCGALAELLLGSSTSEGAVAAVLGASRDAQYRVVHAEPRFSTAEFPLETPLVTWDGSRARAVLAADRDPLTDLDQHHWHVGISAPAAADRLAEADSAAAQMLERARAEGRPMRADAGVAGLSWALDPERAAEFSRRKLAPLIAYPTSASLLRTLRSWLAHNGSWHHTSRELDVHRNSVRHRIRQVERVLGVDLTDTQQRMELWFALQWCPPT